MPTQFGPTQQIGDGGVSSERVRVWFGTHVVADYVADPQSAERYAEAMRQRFAGLRVTCDRAVSSTVMARPLPSERLWELVP